VVPDAIPVATPVVAEIVAIPVNELLHVPGNGPLPQTVVWPIHTCNGPVIGSGIAFTVATAVTEQPVPSVYVTVVVPVVMPVIAPVIASTVPTAGFDDAHVPPGVVVVNVPVVPWHTCNAPPIEDGKA
jgi:hypothetical protein